MRCPLSTFTKLFYRRSTLTYHDYFMADEETLKEDLAWALARPSSRAKLSGTNVSLAAPGAHEHALTELEANTSRFIDKLTLGARGAWARIRTKGQWRRRQTPCTLSFETRTLCGQTRPQAPDTTQWINGCVPGSCWSAKPSMLVRGFLGTTDVLSTDQSLRLVAVVLCVRCFPHKTSARSWL